MDLSSHGVIDEIQLGCHSDLVYMQISTAIIEKSVLFNTVESQKHYVYADVSMVNEYDRHH